MRNRSSDASHMNFEKELIGTHNFFLCPTLVTRRKTPFSIQIFSKHIVWVTKPFNQDDNLTAHKDILRSEINNGVLSHPEIQCINNPPSPK